MTPQQIQTIKATVPVLQQHGATITRVFYDALFQAHPELLNIFNPVNQQNGRQASTLAASILMYAAHIDQLGQLGPMVDRITHKHVSLDVRPEHYPIVGRYLLQAIETVLGQAATPQIMSAWAAAYTQLAEIMIGVEEGLNTKAAAQVGGWRGFKPFVVQGKTTESAVITSFVLAPKDGQALPPFLPGQYLSVQMQVPGHTTQQIRQYSLSDAPNGRTYRISVKREQGSAVPDGLISSHLHADIQEGDEVLVHLPTGEFTLQDSDRPVVLLSGGVGITPMISMLNSLIQTGSTRRVLFVHAALNREVHAFQSHLNSVAASHTQIRKQVYYTVVTPQDRQGEDYDVEGLLRLETLRAVLPDGDAEFYYCGPAGFAGAVERLLDQLQVPSDRRFTETFGPTPSFERKTQTFEPTVMAIA